MTISNTLNTTSAKYIPPHLKQKAKVEPESSHALSAAQESAHAKSTGTLAPISIKNIEWQRLSGAKKSLEGTTGIFFLYFDNHLQPSLCLKLTHNPYNEHYCNQLLASLDLFTPDSLLLDRRSELCNTLCAELEKQSLLFESQGMIERSNQIYCLLTKIKSFDPSIKHILIMECIHGRALDEVRKGDWSHEQLNNDQFFRELGKGLAADAFILNSDRYYFLYAHNSGNFRLPFPKHNTRKSPLCFIDQSVDALRTKEPLLRQDTLLQKFEQLLHIAFQAPGKLSSIEDSTHTFHQGLVEQLAQTAIEPSMKRKAALDHNYIDTSISLDKLVEDLSKDIEAETRYQVNESQKSFIKKGIIEGLSTIKSEKTKEKIQTLHHQLPEHPLKAAIPINLLLLNQNKASTFLKTMPNLRHFDTAISLSSNSRRSHALIP